MTDTYGPTFKISAALAQTQNEQARLLDDLEKSMSLAQMIPGCFDHGSVRACWVDRAATAAEVGSAKAMGGKFRALKEYRVTLGDGTEHRFTPDRVPIRLWPEPFQQTGIAEL